MKLESTQPIGEANKRGVICRSSLYAIVSARSHEAINTLIELLNSKNDNVRLGAAKALLDKCLPSIKVSDLSDENVEKEHLIIIKTGAAQD